MPTSQNPSGKKTFLVRKLISKAVILVVVGTAFGWIYAWASPHLFPREVEAGFARGMAHGALMPMALPSLVIGKQVEIYAANNSGRAYKLGYIVGINVCGLVFFGSAFWRPARNSAHGSGTAPTRDHMNQPR
jgi:hypothetical protein